MEFVYCRQIPLLSIILHTANYTSYTGIPTFHVVLVTFSFFYSIYLFYLYVCFPKKISVLFEYLALLFVVYLMQYNRGGLIINVFVATIILLAANQKKIKFWHIICVVIFAIIGMFIFGCLGNIRHGGTWNDSSYFIGLAKVNDNYPSWLPEQFMWAYIYITTPLGNLNYNIQNNFATLDILNYVVTYVPDFISKRVFSEYSQTSVKLVQANFNATVGFGTAYMSGGVIGMYLMYFYTVLTNIFLIKFIKPLKQYIVPTIGLMNAIVIFIFFTHTISYSAISFAVFYPLITFIIRKKPIKDENISFRRLIET